MIQFEQELTALLMHGYGYNSTRGGDYTELNLHCSPPHDPTDTTPELANALATVDHDELSKFGEALLNGDVENKITEDTPRLVRRNSLKEGRVGRTSSCSIATPMEQRKTPVANLRTGSATTVVFS